MMFTPQFAATFRDLVVQTLALEVETTARVIAAIPNGAREYRPDPRSRSAWQLAWHIAADVWFLEGVLQSQFEVNPDSIHQNPSSSPEELSLWYRNRARTVIERLSSLSAEPLLQPLTLGSVASASRTEYPAFLYLLFAQNHMIHHRGQLSAYLRAMGGIVPNIYGPTADSSG